MTPTIAVVQTMKKRMVYALIGMNVKISENITGYAKDKNVKPMKTVMEQERINAAVTMVENHIVKMKINAQKMVANVRKS